MQTLGFIGMGNMAQAIADGFSESGIFRREELFAYAPNQEKLRRNAESIGFTPCASSEEVCRSADTVLLACKPYQVEEVVRELGEALSGKALLCIALGWNYERLSAIVPASTRIQFIMPNTPVLVGEGILLFEERTSLTAAELSLWKKRFSAVGQVELLPSSLMQIGGALTGCGPAFADLIIEAFADAAVLHGMPRETAYALTSQMLLGSAKLQLETGKHPGSLKDAVCSPGGSTIRGVRALEHAGLRAACMDAVDAALGK